MSLHIPDRVAEHLSMWLALNSHSSTAARTPKPEAPTTSSMAATQMLRPHAGMGDAEDRLAPTSVAALAGAGITAIACGAEYSLAVAAAKQRVYSWGW